jgi:hypothetical protein
MGCGVKPMATLHFIIDFANLFWVASTLLIMTNLTHLFFHFWRMKNKNKKARRRGRLASLQSLGDLFQLKRRLRLSGSGCRKKRRTQK